MYIKGGTLDWQSICLRLLLAVARANWLLVKRFWELPYWSFCFHVASRWKLHMLTLFGMGSSNFDMWQWENTIYTSCIHYLHAPQSPSDLIFYCIIFKGDFETIIISQWLIKAVKAYSKNPLNYWIFLFCWQHLDRKYDTNKEVSACYHCYYFKVRPAISAMIQVKQM